MMFCKKGKIKIFSKRFCEVMKSNDSSVMPLIKASGWEILDYFRRSLLHISAAFGNSIISEYLLRRGCPLEGRDVMGNTPLLLAVYFGHWEVVRLLVRAGASRLASNLSGCGPIFYAMVYKLPETEAKIEELLLRELRPGGLSGEACDALLGQLSKAEELLLGPRERLGRQLGHSGRLALVADRGRARPEELFGAQGLLLNKAIFYRDLFQVRLNLMYWAEPGASDALGLTAVHAAAACLEGEEAAEVLQLLLGHGAPVDGRGRSGLTALHVASVYANVDMLRRLIARGADPGALDALGRSALELLLVSDGACEGCRLPELAEALWLLHRHGLRPGCSLIRLSREADLSPSRSRHHLFVKHLAMLEANGELLHRACARTLHSQLCCKLYYQRCRLELQAMRRAKLYGPLSFHNLLLDSDGALVSYAEDVNVLRSFEEAQVARSFPIYADFLTKRLRDAYARMKFVEKARRLVMYVCGKYVGPKLQSDDRIVTRIIDYLEPRDLHKVRFNSGHDRFKPSNNSKAVNNF